jgi:hypothetical protein
VWTLGGFVKKVDPDCNVRGPERIKHPRTCKRSRALSLIMEQKVKSELGVDRQTQWINVTQSVDLQSF